ncbi:agglutinin-2-like [Papaver somniferum]|uniref:agglutinin-2-like n=1 Tax=Papaver somniferum TaxID=3469 RepID=UPI000E6F5E31|nr:agglutinin-2-like [Papaver somniferum]
MIAVKPIYVFRLLDRTESYGDGITFFLFRDTSSDPPPSSSDGGGLALFSTGKPENTSESNTVAVEFDTFKNAWDPSADHVGINVNSIVSVANVSLEKDSLKDGRTANAWVTYNGTTKNLSVFLTYDNNPVFREQNPILFHIVDLSKVLPRKIIVGFSASMGSGVEIHKILSGNLIPRLMALMHAKGDSNLPNRAPDYSGRRRNFWLGEGFNNLKQDKITKATR